MTGTLTYASLLAAGTDAGVDRMGACDAAPFDDARKAIESRRDQGLHGTMQFTYRNPTRATTPEATFANPRTMLVGATSYHRHRPAPPNGPCSVASTARYVWADDQDRLLAGLRAVATVLERAGHAAIVVSDQNHQVDRAVAHRAGLGWFGKNANLLLPGEGSWFLLGAVVTDAGPDDIVGLPAAAPVADGCGTCVRCIDACPTQAIVAPGTVDARRCLSWSLQATGSFPRDQRVALGNRIYGCDDCQEVCPPNRRAHLRAEPDGRGEGVPEGDPALAWVDLVDLLDASDDDLLDRHGRWYIARRDPTYLRRNALVVLGNVADGSDPAVRRVLTEALSSTAPVVRAHAVWAVRRLGCDDLLSLVAGDEDSDVRDELALPVPRRTPTAQAGP